MDNDSVFGIDTIKMGERIAKRRKELGYTQEQISEIAGLSQNFFACIERGTKNMRAENIGKLVKSLNVSADYILFGKVNEMNYEYFSPLLEQLDEVQIRCFTEITKNYLKACGIEPPL